MNIDAEEVETIETPVKLGDDINADLTAAIAELEKPETERAEDGKFKAEEQEVEVVAEPVKEIPPAPQSWTAEAKAEWANASPRLREEITKRENDFHQALTRHDGDLNLGRQMKEVVTPYLAQIQAEGGTPVTAVQSLLNTAHVLRNGTPEQKRAIIVNTAKQYGVDIGGGEEQEYVDPTIAQLQREIAQLRELANPQVIESRLQERFESAKVKSDIDAFASDPAHIHFETVKPLMASILNAGQASGLKEAYDMACMANPQVRSTLEAAKAAELEAKRKQELANKKRAASSITGSPAIPSNSKVTNPKSSPADDLRAAWDELESRI